MSDWYYVKIGVARRDGGISASVKEVLDTFLEENGFTPDQVTKIWDTDKSGKRIYGITPFMYIIQEWDTWDGSSCLGQRIVDQLEIKLKQLDSFLVVEAYNELNERTYLYEVRNK